MLSHLKKMAHLFGIKWSFVTVTCGMRISSNRTEWYGNSNSPSRRKTSSITCGCDWVVIFKSMNSKKCIISESVEIMQVCSLHTNTCGPSFPDQYVLARTRSGEYKILHIKSLLIRNLVLGL